MYMLSEDVVAEQQDGNTVRLSVKSEVLCGLGGLTAKDMDTPSIA